MKVIRGVTQSAVGQKNMIELTSVQAQEHIAVVANLAREIWTEHYVPIIGRKQVVYMLDRFQSEAAIAAQLADGHEYDIVSHDGRSEGYMALVPDAATGQAMISKIYVRRSGRGQGLGRAMLALAEERCRKRRLASLWLTVNKNNSDAIAWYGRMGFINQGSIVQDIGGGFLMDDYRMERNVD